MAKTKLRIVHTVSSLEGGGMEHFVLRLVEAQRRHGHDASILALRGGPLDDLARQRALPATVLSGKKLERIARAALGFAAARPDIVHAHNPTSLHYAVIGKLLTRAPLVFTDHAQTRGIIRVPTRFEWRQTDVVVGCSGWRASSRWARPTLPQRASTGPGFATTRSARRCRRTLARIRPGPRCWRSAASSG